MIPMTKINKKKRAQFSIPTTQSKGTYVKYDEYDCWANVFYLSVYEIVDISK